MPTPLGCGLPPLRLCSVDSVHATMLLATLFCAAGLWPAPSGAAWPYLGDTVDEFMLIYMKS